MKGKRKTIGYQPITITFETEDEEINFFHTIEKIRRRMVHMGLESWEEAQIRNMANIGRELL